MTAGAVAVFIIIVWAAYALIRHMWKGVKCVCNKCDECRKRNFIG